MPARRHWKIFVELPKEYRAEHLQPIVAEEVIDLIKTRTQAGKDVDGKKFPAYTKAYIKSLNFRNAAKNPSNVNLTLSGDMLASIKVLKNTSKGFWIGFEKGLENDKAEGNILGTYGKKRANPEKARHFLGISEKELKKVFKKIPIRNLNEGLLKQYSDLKVFSEAKENKVLPRLEAKWKFLKK